MSKSEAVETSNIRGVKAHRCRKVCRTFDRRFLIAAADEESGLHGEHVAMVVKDVATNFMYIYPSGARTARDAILALKHFIRHDDQVGVLYSDNAPELLKALKTLEWRHVLSREYISHPTPSQRGPSELPLKVRGPTYIRQVFIICNGLMQLASGVRCKMSSQGPAKILLGK